MKERSHENESCKDGVRYLNVAENEKICSEGSYGTEMYVIIDGKVKISLRRKGEDFELTTLEAGEFFGEMCLLEDEPRSADAIAVEPTTLMVIDKISFNKVAQKNPSLIFKIMKALSCRLRESNERLLEYKHEFESQLGDILDKNREE